MDWLCWQGVPLNDVQPSAAHDHEVDVLLLGQLDELHLGDAEQEVHLVDKLAVACASNNTRFVPPAQCESGLESLFRINASGDGNVRGSRVGRPRTAGASAHWSCATRPWRASI